MSVITKAINQHVIAIHGYIQFLIVPLLIVIEIELKNGARKKNDIVKYCDFLGACFDVLIK